MRAFRSGIGIEDCDRAPAIDGQNKIPDAYPHGGAFDIAYKTGRVLSAAQCHLAPLPPLSANLETMRSDLHHKSAETANLAQKSGDPAPEFLLPQNVHGSCIAPVVVLK